MTVTGIGWDTHRLVAERPLILGGVRIESELGLDGHSDADVLTHAIIDAMLGAAGLGDIGEHFPDTDPRWAGADSISMLAAVDEMLHDVGLRVGHVDCTVIAERPKLAPVRDRIRESLRAALSLNPGQVNVKATRGEGMGPVGRGEGIVAMAVVTAYSDA